MRVVEWGILLSFVAAVVYVVVGAIVFSIFGCLADCPPMPFMVTLFASSFIYVVDAFFMILLFFLGAWFVDNLVSQYRERHGRRFSSTESPAPTVGDVIVSLDPNSAGILGMSGPAELRRLAQENDR